MTCLNRSNTLDDGLCFCRKLQARNWWGGQSRSGAPLTIADFDPNRDVNYVREATVVAKDRLTAEADESFDMRGVRIDGQQGSRR